MPNSNPNSTVAIYHGHLVVSTLGAPEGVPEKNADGSLGTDGFTHHIYPLEGHDGEFARLADAIAECKKRCPPGPPHE